MCPPEPPLPHPNRSARPSVTAAPSSTPDVRKAQPPIPEHGSALRTGGAPQNPGLPGPSHGTDTPLPHERDQSLGETAPRLDPMIVQAKRDIDAGMVDTDMRASPGLDAERRAQLVPGPPPNPGPEPERSTRRPLPKASGRKA